MDSTTKWTNRSVDKSSYVNIAYYFIKRHVGLGSTIKLVYTKRSSLATEAVRVSILDPLLERRKS